MRTCVVLLLVVVLGAGCVTERNIVSRKAAPEQSADDAVGFVTVSTPFFTPMDSFVDGDDRLDFGSMKKESKIAELLQKPAFGSEEVTVNLFRMALAAKIAGVAVDMSEVTNDVIEPLGPPAPDAAPAPGGSGECPEEDEGVEVVSSSTSSSTEDDAGVKMETTKTKTHTRSFKTPAPIDAAALTLPGIDLTTATNSEGQKLGQILLDMLSPNANKTYTLPLDEVVTLVAALKTYMVNLEEYYNVEGYDYARGISNKYVPYKMHFTVTAEPGWFSRYRQHDGVVDIKFSLPPSLCAEQEKLLILSASPAEVGQTVEEFAAELNQFAASMSASAPIQSFGQVGARAEAMMAAARRLQGTRVHKTMAIGFPDSDRLRVRFIAQRAATPRGQDLQAVSRLITAIVLVPKKGADAWGQEVERDARALAEDATFLGYQTDLEDIARDGRIEVGAALRDSLDRAISAYDRRRRADGGDADATYEFAIRRIGRALQGEFTHFGLGKAQLTASEVQYEQLRKTIKGMVRIVVDLMPPWLSRGLRSPGARDVDSVWTAIEKGTWFLGADGLQDAPPGPEENQPGSGDSVWFMGVPKDVGDVWEDAIELRKYKEKYGNGFSRKWAGQRLLIDIYRTFERAHRTLSVMEKMNVLGDTDVLEDWEENRARVERFLMGTSCSFTVSSYFAPTVFDHRGNWAPPRQYPFRIRPPADRLLAFTECSPRAAPIPPWMGPLKQRPKIEQANGYYDVDVSCFNEQEAQLALAKARLAATSAKFAAAKGNALYKALVAARAEKRKAGQATQLALARKSRLDAGLEEPLKKAKGDRAAEGKQDLRPADEVKRLEAKLEVEYRKAHPNKERIEDLTKQIDVWRQRKEEKGKAYRDVEKIAELDAMIDSMHKAMATAQKLVTESRSKQADAEAVVAIQEADTAVQKAAAAVDGLKPKVAEAKARVAQVEAQVALLRPAAMGRGHAVVSFSYSSPPLLLDDSAKQIRETDTYVRVLGLKRVRASRVVCSATGVEADDKKANGESAEGTKARSKSSGYEGAGVPAEFCGIVEGCCAPGEFCKIAQGLQETSLLVRDVDLSTAIDGDPRKKGALLRPIRAYLQLLVVPRGVKPLVGLSHPAGSARVMEITVQPRVSGVPAPGGGVIK